MGISKLMHSPWYARSDELLAISLICTGVETFYVSHYCNRVVNSHTERRAFLQPAEHMKYSNEDNAHPHCREPAQGCDIPHTSNSV